MRKSWYFLLKVMGWIEEEKFLFKIKDERGKQWELYRESEWLWTRYTFPSRPRVYVFCCKVLFSAIWITGGGFFLSGVFYGTVLNLCLLYQSQRLRVLTLCFNSVCVCVCVCVCACAFIYSGGVQRDRLSFKHMPGTSGRLQSSRGNKEQVRQKASPWLQATVEAATQEFKISFFSKSIYSSTPLCSLFPFYSLQYTRKTHMAHAQRTSPSGPGSTFALDFPPFLREKWWCWFPVVTSLSFDCSRFAYAVLLPDDIWGSFKEIALWHGPPAVQQAENRKCQW